MKYSKKCIKIINCLQNRKHLLLQRFSSQSGSFAKSYLLPSSPIWQDGCQPGSREGRRVLDAASESCEASHCIFLKRSWMHSEEIADCHLLRFANIALSDGVIIIPSTLRAGPITLSWLPTADGYSNQFKLRFDSGAYKNIPTPIICLRLSTQTFHVIYNTV